MATRKKALPSTNGSVTKVPSRVSRQEMKEILVSVQDPTKGYQPTRYSYWGDIFVQQLPPFRLWTGRVMLTSDPIVQLMLNVRNAALMAAEVTVEAKNPRVQEWVQRQWDYLWNHHRLKMTSAKEVGFAPLQLLWKDKDGLAEIKRVKDFQPEDCRALEKGGRIVGQSVKGKRIWCPQTLWLTYGAKYGSAYGQGGCLRRAYPAWYEKWMDHGAKRLLQLAMIKHSMIGDILWYPPNISVELPNGKKIPWQDFMREMGENRLSGATVTMPMLYNSQGKELTKYTPPTDTGVGQGAMGWIDECNEGILWGGDIPTEVIKASTTGSGFSGRSIPFLVVLSTCNNEFIEIIQRTDEQSLRPAAWMNFGGDPEYEIKPRNLVESFSEDTSGSAMGGSAVGTPMSGGQPPPGPATPPQGGNVQFGEELGHKGRWLHGWLDRHGNMIHLKEGQSHSDYAHSIKSHPEAMFKQGHQRVTVIGNDIIAHNGHKPPNVKQRNYLRDWAIAHKFSRVTHDNDENEKTIWSNSEVGSQHSEEGKPHKYSTTQFNILGSVGARVLDLASEIREEDLAEDGRETEPHVTVLYGISGDDAGLLIPAVTACGPIAIQFGDCSVFHADVSKPAEPGLHDVVKIDVISEGLHKLHELIKATLPHVETHPEYKPHITLAYVKPGLGTMYAERLNNLKGTTITLDRLIFSNRERERTYIPLCGQAQFSQVDYPQEDKPLHAPPGGVTIHGVAYKGGEFIPKEVIAELSPSDKTKLRAGAIARHIKNRPELAERKQVDPEVDPSITETQQFQNWFEGSKVVDSKGEPLVVYHGTHSKFDEFDKSKLGNRDAGDYGKGFYFSQSRANAEMYAEWAIGGGPSKKRERVIMPVYLSLKNPLEMSKEMDEETAKKIVEDASSNRVRLGKEPLQDLESHARKLREKFNTASEVVNQTKERARILSNYISTEGLARIGFDGVLGTNEIVAFEPNQIKSASGSNKTFDKTKSNIHFEEEGGSPLSGVTFPGLDYLEQFEESEALKKLRTFVTKGMTAKLQLLREKVVTLKESGANLGSISGEVEREIRLLRPFLSASLGGSNYASFVRGVADIVQELPSEIAKLAPNVPEGLPLAPPRITGAMFPEVPEPEAVFPDLDDAITVLERKPVAAGIDYRETARLVREGAFAVTGELEEAAVEEIRDKLSEAIREGHSQKEFITAVEDRLDKGKLSPSHLENIFRTNAMSLYSDGRAAGLSRPLVSDYFPYVSYSATHDKRLRENHGKLEKLGIQGTNIYRADDPVFKKFRPPWDYQCRCTWTPMTVEQAARAGIREAIEWKERAERIAAEKGGTFYQYLSQTPPMVKTFVDNPDFEPPPEFARPALA